MPITAGSRALRAIVRLGLPLLAAFPLAALAPGRADAQILFGPQPFTLTTSSPQTASVAVSAPAGPAHLHVRNGAADGSGRLAHASLLLNGVEVVGPRTFGADVALVDVPVTLDSSNVLTVVLTGPVGGTLEVTLERREASLLSVLPAGGRQGETVTVTVVGSDTRFAPGLTQLWAGPGIGVGGAPAGQPGPVTVQDATHLSATLAIQPTTVLGARTLLALTGGERAALPAGFTVLAATPAVEGTTVTTLAGTGSPGLADGPASTAQFRLPLDAAGLASGAAVVADTGNSRLRALAADGTVSSVPLPVMLRLPGGVAVDPAGRTVVADTAACVVRLVQADGSVTTIGQAGACGFADGPAETARFRLPRDAAADAAGNVYVADTGNFRVRRIAPDGSVVTVAGSGAFGGADGPAAAATFGLLAGVAAAADGSVLVADAAFHRIRKIDPAGTVTTVAGTGAAGFADGPAAAAQLAFPTALALDASGTLYVADTLNNLVRRLTPAGAVETLAGTGAFGRQDGPGAQASFSLPFGLGLFGDAPGRVLVADTAGHTVRLVRVEPVVTAIAPASAVHGTTITAFTVTGANLLGASRLDFLRDGAPDPAITATDLAVSADGRQLTATVDVAGTAAPGARTVRVTAPGGTASAPTAFTVLGRITLVPDFQILKAGRQGALAVQLSTPAPAGGLSVSLESADPAVVTVASPVVVAAGEAGAATTVSAVAEGTTNVTASAPGFANGLAAVTVVTNRPPELAPIGDQVAPLGRTLAFTVGGADPDGDAVAFGVTPLPLPAHATFDRLTGRFTFTPAADQVGNVTLTFTVSDGEAIDAETILLTVPAPPPGGVTAFSGRVLDANAAEAGVEVPVVGATISFLGTGRAALTGADGRFTVTDLPAGRQVLDIAAATAGPAPDGSPYAGFREAVGLVAGVTTVVERPFFLPRIDQASLTTVDPNATTVVRNPTLGVTLTVPPHTAKDAAGNDFTGRLSISLVPRGLAPAALPELLDPGLLVTIQPVGVTFATPAPITFPNLDGLAAGSEANIWSLDADRGVFTVVGLARVSADGARIETIAGGIRAADWHAPLPPAPLPGGPGPGPNGPPYCTTCPIGSSVTADAGGLLVDLTLPPVRSLGAARSLQLMYSSLTADVRPVVPLDAQLSVRAAVPPRFSAALEVGGATQGPATFYDSTSLPENADSRSRLALQVTARGLPTGRYPYRARVVSHYAQSSIGAFLDDHLMVVNRQASPFGSGWGLLGLQRLHQQTDGSIMFTDGDGAFVVYEPSGAEGFSAIEYALVPNGGFESGTGTTVEGFSPAGPAVLGLSTERVLFGQASLAVDPTFTRAAGQTGAAVVSAPIPVTPGVPYVLSGFIWNDIVGGGAAYLDLADAAVDPSLTHPDAPALSTSGLGEWEFVSILFTPQVSSVQVRAVVDGSTGPIQAGSRVFFDNLALTPATAFHLPPPANLIRNGGFEAGTLSGFTASGINGGLALLTREGVRFSADPIPPAGVPSARIPIPGTFAANVRSSGPAPVDSVGILTSEPFTAGRLLAFLERSESRNVDIEVRVLDASDQVLISRKILDPSTTRWTRRTIDTSAFEGRTIRVQLRQHTTQAGSGFYTLIDDIVSDFTPGQFVSPAGEFATLGRNPDGTFTRQLKDGTRIHFDPQGRQTAVVDRNGNTTAYAYDAAGRLTTVTDPAGLVTALAYDGATGRLETITDPAGRVTRVAHDAAGNLVQVVQPDGSRIGYAYDAEHRLVRKTDERGAVTTYTYDFAGRLAAVAQPTGEVRRLQPHETQGLADVGAGEGTATSPVPVVRSEQAFASVTDGLGRATRFTVNRFGAPLTQTDPLGRVTTTVRDAASLPVRITRPNGAVTTMVYDDRGNLLRSTEQAIGATTTFTYDSAFNQVTSITDPRGGRTTIAHDARGNPVRITDALGQATEQTYDARGLLTAVRDALGQVTSFAYDARGNLVSTTDPLGRVTTLSYDAAGNVASSTDALGRVTRFEYDPMNRLTVVTDPAGGETRYTYDAKGNLVALTDAKGQATTFAYDAVGQLVRTTNPLGQAKAFSYDLARNLVLVVDAMGQRLELAYDAGSQLVQKVLKDPAGGATDTVTFAYDELGNRTLAADGDSGLAFAYDALGRLTRVETAATAAQPAAVVTYSYDANGNRVRMTDPQGAATSYGYDALNRLTSLTSPDGTTTFAYDALSRRTTLTLPNGTRTTAGYDAASQLRELVTTAGPATISRHAYTYDAVGNRDTRTTLSGVSSYAYDALSRLVEARQPDPVDPLQPLTERFTYDAVGNRTASHRATGQVYDAANRLLEDSQFTYAYDAAGNLTRRTERATGATTTYRYDVENRLVGVTGPGLEASYAYDALGRRIAKTVDGVTIRFVYDQEDILAEYGGAGMLQARYTHGPGIDEPLIRTDLPAGQRVVYHADALGTITALTDETGAVVQRYAYEAFGSLLGSQGPVAQPYTYTGRELDAESSLYYYRARYYDPAAGRFLQEDPIGIAGGIHTYVYVNGNPTNSSDPLGLFTTRDFVWHYYRGGGAPVDLGEVGLLNAFKNSSSVVAAVAVFKNLMELAAKQSAESSCQNCGQGRKPFEFGRRDTTVTNVTTEPGLFVVGHSTLFRTALCSGVVDCSIRAYSYFCNMRFSIDDWFRDPLGIKIEAGGTPYRIRGGWSEGVTGSGSF